MELDLGASLNLAIGLMQLVLVLAVLRSLGRFGRSFPWLLVLLVFFAARGVDRLYVALADEEPVLFSAALDVLVLFTLGLLLVGLDRTVRGLRGAMDDAELRTLEYERALSDYRTLARHRLANPLASVRGGIKTLREMDLDPELRDDILEMIDAEAQRLEHVALDPEPAGPEEVTLRPRPEIGQAE